MAEFGNQTVPDFWHARKLAFKRKAGSTGRKAAGLSHHEWGFYGFLFSSYPLELARLDRPRTSES
jgi:hypothetical protein